MKFDWLIEFLHSFPHFNFNFHFTSDVFNPSDQEYLQAIALWAIASCIVGFIFLVITLFVWCVRCCCKRPKEPAKRLKQIRALSSGLFAVSVLCFAWLGVALFANERANRGLGSTADSLAHLSADIGLAVQKVGMVNRTLAKNVSDVELLKFSAAIAGATQNLNESEKETVRALMHNVSHSVDEAVNETLELQSALSSLHSIARSTHFIFRLEDERWIIFATLLSIMLVVLFGGVVGFCRHSKKAAVLFSGLGLVIFILAWSLLALVLAAALALADFCADPAPYVLAQFASNKSREFTDFYLTCYQNDSEALPPPFLQSETEIRTHMGWLDKGVAKVTTFGKQHFSPEVVLKMEQAVGNISSALEMCGMELTRTEQLLSCSGSLERDYEDAHHGLCHVALSGAGLGLVALLLLGLSLFVLLVCLSKAWHLYTKRPLDYVEVEDEDPFLPRGSGGFRGSNDVNGLYDTTIPADFYGTHVYNPRTRFASNGDSEGNLTATGDGATPLWSRTAPPPPAYDVVGNGRYRGD